MGFLDIFKRMVGTNNEREVNKLRPMVSKIDSLEPQMQALTDQEFIPKMNEFRERLDRGEHLDKLLPEVFALVREAGVRTMGMRHYPVQMIGGMVLHAGRIAEMKTGEGKTLVATLPLVLNALTGRGVHLVTVNDYLATRDADWMGKIYKFLGLSVGVITNDLSDSRRQKNYGSDITYGTNNEFGFDYLRDNMKFDLSRYVQRELHFAIVDEVDSILVDEARTPLIISGPTDEATDLYYEADRIMPQLQRGLHFSVDEKSRTALLTDEGVAKVEGMLRMENLYDPKNILMLHHVHQSLCAHALYKKDIDYMVKGGQVMIIDEHTGRALPGRRWSDGLHQAVEAKEKVKIEGETETLATISFQNYFRLYDKLSGMTGTAETEAAEFHKTYKLDVVVIPTNKPVIRADHQDSVYRTEREKFEAVVEEVAEAHERGQPTLVGTISIERSEILHKMLTRKKIPHNVLNARHHEREAEIVAQAGHFGAVTIATNMAGRGTDIVLGGNLEPFIHELLKKHSVDPESIEATLFVKSILRGGPDDPEGDKEARRKGKALANISEDEFKEVFRRRNKWKVEAEEVREAGGLYIVGTERHDSRRIDNQLRGRSGRQGDPGASRFYLSLEDDLMRRFGSDRLSSIMETLGMEYGEPIEHRMVSKAIENAQKKVEQHNFEIRKNMLEYDDVMNIQRKTIYTLRRELLGSDDVRQKILTLMEEVLYAMSRDYCDEKTPVENWDMEGFEHMMRKLFAMRFIPNEDELREANEPREALIDQAWEGVLNSYKLKEQQLGGPLMRQLEKELYLLEIDEQWKGHLKGIEQLREGIGLQGYRQMDPKLVYKKEAYNMFEALLERIRGGVVEKMFHMEIETQEDIEQTVESRRKEPQNLEMHRGGVHGDEAPEEEAKPATIRRERPKIGRNDPCWCGSGKKYKKCHLSQDARL